MKPPLLLPGRISPLLQNRQTPVIKQINYPKNISFFFKKKFKPDEKNEKTFKKPKSNSEKESWLEMLSKGTYENFLQRIKYIPSLKGENKNIVHDVQVKPRIFNLTSNTGEPKPSLPLEPDIPPQINLIPPKAVETRMMELNEQHKMGLRNTQNMDVSKYTSKLPYSELVPLKHSENEVHDSDNFEQTSLFSKKYRCEDSLTSSSGKRPLTFNSPSNITESDTKFKLPVHSLLNGQNITSKRLNQPLMESGRKNLQYFTTKINNFSKDSQPLITQTRAKSSDGKGIKSVLTSLRSPKIMKRSVQKNTNLKKLKKVDMIKRNIKNSLTLTSKVPNSLENIKYPNISSFHIKPNKKNMSKLIKTVSRKKMPHHASHTSFTAISFKRQDKNKSKVSSKWKVRKWLKNIDNPNKIEKNNVAYGKSIDKYNKINKKLKNAEKRTDDLNNSNSKLFMRKNNDNVSAVSEKTYEVKTHHHSLPFFKLKSLMPKKRVKLTAQEILAKYSLDRMQNIAPTNISLQRNLAGKNNDSYETADKNNETAEREFISIKGYKSIQTSILDKIQQRMKPENNVTLSLERSSTVSREKLQLTKYFTILSSNNPGSMINKREENNNTVKCYIEGSGHFKDREILLNKSGEWITKQGYLRNIFHLDRHTKNVNNFVSELGDQEKSFRTKEDMEDMIKSLQLNLENKPFSGSSPNPSVSNYTRHSNRINPSSYAVFIGQYEKNEKEDFKRRNENVSTMIKGLITDPIYNVPTKYRLKGLKDQLNMCSSVVPIDFYKNPNNNIAANETREENNEFYEDIYSALQSKSESQRDLIISGIFPNIYLNNVYRGFLDENSPYFHLSAHLYKYIDLKPELLYINCLKYFPLSIAPKGCNENQMQGIFHTLLQNRLLPNLSIYPINLNKNQTFQSEENKKQYLSLPVIQKESISSLLTHQPIQRITKRNFSTSYQNLEEEEEKPSGGKTHHLQEKRVTCKKKRKIPCKKIRLPGCRKANIRCTGILEHLPCMRREPPEPSFSECIKFPIQKPEFSECDCHKKKKRGCVSNIKKPKHYDGCTKPKEKKKRSSEVKVPEECE